MKTEITEQEKQAIRNASIKHILPLVGNHVTAEDVNNALDKIADTAIEVLFELRKPSEDICPKCGYPIRLQGNGIMERICTCNHAKPSEDLIKEILIILDEHSDTDESGASFLLGGEYEEIASEIAKLLASFRSQQNDVNAALLEAAKYFRDAWNCEWSKLTAKTDDINKHNIAISNA